ncbi:MAG: PAS domain S-box protein [Anaerolineales bacterium]|nr:PAS domain S-box protein [Anaerolineales bacterium]
MLRFFLANLRSRIVLLVLLALLPALGLILYANLSTRRANITQAHQETLRVAQIASRQQQLLVEDTGQLLAGLAQIPQLHNSSSANCAAFLGNLLAKDSRYANFGVADLAGNIICSARSLPPPVSLAGQSWFQQVPQNREATVGNYQKDPLTNKFVLPIGYPLLDAAGQPEAVLLTWLDLTWFDQLGVAAGLPAGSVLAVIDWQGTILARYPDPVGFVGRIYPDSPVVQAVRTHQGEGTGETVGLDGVRRLYAFTPLFKNLDQEEVYVSVGIPTDVALAEVDRLSQLNLSALVLSALLALVAAWLGSDLFILRRVKKLVNATRQLAAGDWSVRSGIANSPDEVGELGHAFDEMTGTLQSQQRELQQAEQRYRTLFEGAPLMDVIVRIQDGHPIIADCNELFARTLGYERAEILGQSIEIFYTPSSQAKSQYVRKTLTGRPITDERELVTREGQVIQTLLQSFPETDGQGQVSEIRAMYVDITERKQAEAALQASQARLAGIVNISEDAIIAINPAQEITLFSQGAEKIFGYQAEEMVGQPLDLLLPKEYRAAHRQKVQSFMTSGDVLRPMNSRGLVFGQRKAGKIFPAEASISQFEVGGEKMLVVRLRDITERKRTEAELERYQTQLEEMVATRTGELLAAVAQLEQEVAERKRVEAELSEAKVMAEVANRAKSEFLAHMSHELRTPLNGIMGYAQILQREARRRGEAEMNWLLEGLSTVHRSSEHLLTLINDILDLSKIEAGRMDLHPVTFRVNEFLQMIADMARLQAEQKELAFKYDILSPLPTVVRGDPRRLRQVLLNLLSNAVKFTEQGQVTFSVSATEADLREQSEYLFRFEVADSGIGIAPGQWEQIFQPFHQIDGLHSIEGAGLGLPISRKLAELMGGELHVESHTGQGSTFWLEVRLPVVTDWVDAPAASHIVGYEGSRYKILVIDDNRDNRAVLVNLLAPLGFEVMEAVDGLEGLLKASETRPDLVLLDLVMPGLSGLEVAQHLRQSPELNEVIIIAVSASAFGVTRQQSLAAGCNDFLSKPVQVEMVLDTLQRYLGLTWILGEQGHIGGENGKVNSEEVSPSPPGPDTLPVGPPPAEAALLFELAQMGDIVGIRSRLAQLKQADENLSPFVAEIQRLTKSFDLEKICNLVKPYMEEGYGI